jgi:hypothetical protein
MVDETRLSVVKQRLLGLQKRGGLTSSHCRAIFARQRNGSSHSYLDNAARCESGRQSGNRGQPKRSSDVGGTQMNRTF